MDKMFSELLYGARTMAGLTQAALAKKLRTKQATISRAESNGVGNIRWLAKAIKACGYDIEVHHISLVKGNTKHTRFFGGKTV